MAQSRMAGVAMGLGPSDLADVGEAATLATNKMGMEQGQQASVTFNLDTGKKQNYNDGEPRMDIRSGGRDYHVTPNRSTHKDALRYPVKGFFGRPTNVPNQSSQETLGDMNYLRSVVENGRLRTGEELIRY